MMSTQSPKGRWVYSWEFKKYFFIDEQNRIIDPEVAQLQKPANLPNVLTPISIQRTVAPAAPIQRNEVQRNVAPAPNQRIVAPAPTRRTVSPAQIQRNVAPAPRPVPQQRRNVAPAPVPQQRNVAPAVQRQTTVIPAPANFAQRLAAPTTRVQRTTPRAQPRRNRSASVSSSGSSRSARSTSSRRSASAKKTERYQKVVLRRQAVLRRGPSLNTRVVENLDQNTEVWIDSQSVLSIWYNDNLRKRVKIIDPKNGKKKGWVTVETENGKLYRKSTTPGTIDFSYWYY
jgi:hypothetical protein